LFLAFYLKKPHNINTTKSLIANKILGGLTANSSKKFNLTTIGKFDADIKRGISHTASEPISFIINPNDVHIVSEVGTPLGTGQFGLVRKAIWTTHKGTKLNVAVKTIKPANDRNGGGGGGGLQAFSDMLNEISCMCGLHHKNLITLYGKLLFFLFNVYQTIIHFRKIENDSNEIGRAFFFF
jgi:hypothetical protein